MEKITPAEAYKEFSEVCKCISEKMEEKKQRGGVRAGAGRPLNVSGEKKTPYRVSFRPDVIRTLREMGNFSKFVEEAVLEKLERENIQLK